MVYEDTDKEKIRAYKRDYARNKYRERRAYAINYLGGKCVVCGARYNLDVDHIDPEEKDYNPFGSWWSVPIEIFNEELDKCQLLCRACHIKKTLENKDYGHEAQHGTTYMYMEYACRCELCVKAMREAWARYKRTYRKQERVKDYVQSKIKPHLNCIKKEEWPNIIDAAKDLFYVEDM